MERLREKAEAHGEGRSKEEGGGMGGQVVGMGRGMLVHLPAPMVLTDIFPTAPCLGGIIAHDYGRDQHDRLSLISLTSAVEVIQAVTRIAPDMKS